MPREIRTPCPKCGSEWVRIQHIATCGCEYLRHACSTCGYVWREETKDATEGRRAG